jgi:hypothetical protein
MGRDMTDGAGPGNALGTESRVNRWLLPQRRHKRGCTRMIIYGEARRLGLLFAFVAFL